jgi:hypothetical protein
MLCKITVLADPLDESLKARPAHRHKLDTGYGTARQDEGLHTNTILFPVRTLLDVAVSPTLQYRVDGTLDPAHPQSRTPKTQPYGLSPRDLSNTHDLLHQRYLVVVQCILAFRTISACENRAVLALTSSEKGDNLRPWIWPEKPPLGLSLSGDLLASALLFRPASTSVQVGEIARARNKQIRGPDGPDQNSGMDGCLSDRFTQPKELNWDGKRDTGTITGPGRCVGSRA